MPDNPLEIDPELLNAGYAPPPLMKIVRGAEKLKGVRPELLDHWNNLQKEFDNAGVRPEIKSGFRSRAQQQALYNNPATRARTKGNDGIINISPHQEGRGLDISFNAAQKSKGRQIIADYARRNGLHVPSDEPWHIALPKQQQSSGGLDPELLNAGYGDDAPPKRTAPVGAAGTNERPKSQVEIDPELLAIGSGASKPSRTVFAPPSKNPFDVKSGVGAGVIREPSRADLEKPVYESQRGQPSHVSQTSDELRVMKGEQPSNRQAYSRQQDAQTRLSRMQDESYRERQAREARDAEWRAVNQPEIERQTKLYREDIQKAKRLAGNDADKWLAEFGTKAMGQLAELAPGDTARIHSEAALRAAEEEGADRSQISKGLQNIGAGFIGSAPELGAMALGVPPVAAFAGGSAIRSKSSDPMEVAAAAEHGGLTGLAFETPGVGEGVKRIITKSLGVGGTSAGLELAQGATPGEALTTGATNALMVGVPEVARLRGERNARQTETQRQGVQAEQPGEGNDIQLARVAKTAPEVRSVAQQPDISVDSAVEQPHHSATQLRRARNTEHGTKGQFKEGKVPTEQAAETLPESVSVEPAREQTGSQPQKLVNQSQELATSPIGSERQNVESVATPSAMAPKYQALIDIENNLGVFANRSIPPRKASDAGKLHDAIRSGDLETVRKIATRYERAALKGDSLTGGPKEFTPADVVDSTIGRLAQVARFEMEKPSTSGVSQTLTAENAPVVSPKPSEPFDMKKVWRQGRRQHVIDAIANDEVPYKGWQKDYPDLAAQRLQEISAEKGEQPKNASDQESGAEKLLSGEGAANSVAPSQADFSKVAVNESPETLQLQADRVNQAKVSVMLYNPGQEVLPHRKGLTETETEVGTWVHDPSKVSAKEIKAKVADGTYHEILGIAEPKSAATDRVVTARAPDGTEIESAAVSPQSEAAQAKAYQERSPDATIETGTGENIVKDRASEIAPFTEAELKTLQAEAESLQPKVFTKSGARRQRIAPDVAKRWDELVAANQKLREYQTRERARVKEQAYEDEAKIERVAIKRAESVLGLKQGDEALVYSERQPDMPPARIKFDSYEVNPAMFGKARAALTGTRYFDDGTAESLVLSVNDIKGVSETGNYRIEKSAEQSDARVKADYEAQHGSADAPDRLLKNSRAAELFDKIDKGTANEAETNEFRELARRYGVPDEATNNAIESATSEARPEVPTPSNAEKTTNNKSQDRPVTVSIKNAAIEADRAELDLPELTRAQRIGWQESQARARAKGYDKPDVADMLADRVLEGKKKGLDHEESAGMQIRILELKKEHRKLRDEIANEKDPEKVSELVARAAAVKEQFHKLSDASKQGGSDEARALSIRRSFINEDYDFLSLERDWKTDTGKDLIGRNAKTVEEQSKEIERLTRLLEKEQEKSGRLEADSAVKRIQRDIAKEGRKQERGRRVKTLDDEAVELKDLIALAWKKNKTQSGVQPSAFAKLDPEGEITKLVLKLARNRVQKGTVTAEGVVDEVHRLLRDVIDDLNKRDVRQMISGYGREAKPQSELQNQLNALKSELRRGLEAEDVAVGTRSARREGPTLREGTGKKEGPSMGPKLGPRDSWPARQKALEKQIAEVERKIRDQDFSEKAKRGPTVLTPEAQRIADRLEAVKNQYQNLKRANEPGAGLRNAAAVRKAWMLSWIKTHVRNIAGTGLYQPFDEISRPLAASVDAVLSLRFAGERSVQGASPSAALNAMIHAVKVGGPEAMEIMKRGATRADMERHQVQEINFGVNTGNKIIDQGVHAIELAHNGIFRFMSASDKVFWEQAYKRNLIDRSTIQARNEKRNDPSVSVKERAKEIESDKQIVADSMADAYVSTFNNSNSVSDTVKMARGYLAKKLGPERGAAANFAIDLFIPFDRTPTNVIARVLEASPVGVVKAVTGGYKKSPLKVAKSIIDKSMTREERRQFSQAIGHGGTGSGLMVMAWYLVPKGILTVDDKDNVFLNVLGQKINISLLSPIGNILAIGARLRNAHDKGTLTAGSATKIAGRTPLDQPLLRGTSQVTEFLRDPDRSAGRVGASLAFSGVPFSGAVRGVGETIDPAESRFADSTFKQQFQRNVPKWRESLPETNEKQARVNTVEKMRNGNIPADSELRSQGYTSQQIAEMKKDAKLTSFQLTFSNAHPDKSLERYERMSEFQRYQVKKQMEHKAFALKERADYLLTNAKPEDKAKRQQELDTLKKRLSDLSVTPRDPKDDEEEGSSPFKFGSKSFKIPAFK